MALNSQLSDISVNAAVAAVLALANSGKLRIYSGSQPANANTAIGAQVLLAELTFNATAFGAPTAGVATANAITSDPSADASGTAAWCRIVKSDGTTVLFDGTVGTSGCNLNLTSTTITAGQPVAVASFTYIHPEA